MSASQEHKKYLAQLARGAGIPAIRAKLEQHVALGRVGSFQLFCQEKLDATPKQKNARKSEMSLAEMVEALLSEDDDEVGVVVVEAPAKPTRTRKTRTRKSSAQTFRWNEGVWNRYGIKPKVGFKFQSRGGKRHLKRAIKTHRVIEVGKGFVITEHV